MRKEKDTRAREINHGQSLAGFNCELSVKLEHLVLPFLHPLSLSFPFTKGERASALWLLVARGDNRESFLSFSLL